MQLRATSSNDCVEFRFEGGLSASSIRASVGQGGFNIHDDARKIQRLLSLVSPPDGGPVQALKEDGIVGPKTLAAIKAFQTRQGTGHDGRIDPGGETLRRLNNLPKPALAAKNAARMARVTRLMPDLLAMSEKARFGVDRAIDFLQLGQSGLGTSQKAFDIANLYFAFGNQPAGASIAELSFIRTTYLRVRTVIGRRFDANTAGSPFGVSVFTIDPLGLNDVAYSRRQSADDNREIPEVHSGLIYLCDKSDIVPADLLPHVLFHELIHFVDDENGGRAIDDAGKYREKAMKAPHLIRMRNADNFALFATHLHFGRDRLIASQPTLAPLIPPGL
ncbi:MAG: peptidoglycan-binding protein [Pyrinomonadaceae bacterium]